MVHVILITGLSLIHFLCFFLEEIIERNKKEKKIFCRLTCISIILLPLSLAFSVHDVFG